MEAIEESSQRQKQPPSVAMEVTEEESPQRRQQSISIEMEVMEETTPISPKLLTYDEIPAWLQDNKFILHGYRPVSQSTRISFTSWLYLHNETVNIYSHLVPGLFYLAAQAVFHPYLQAKYPKATTGDHIIFALFLAAAATCLSLSATYHTIMSHSERVSNLWLQLDFVGIIVLMLGDFVSGIYMGFYCEPVLQKIYWAVVTVLCFATVFVLLHPKLQGLRWRTFRVCTFIVTGLSGLLPLLHGIVLFGFKRMMEQSGMPFYLGEGALFILGAVFYVRRIPELLKPGTFDIFGCSHQIFHILVVLGTVVQLVGLLYAFDYNYHHRCVAQN